MLRHLKRFANVSFLMLRKVGMLGQSEAAARGLVVGVAAWIFLRRFSNTFGFSHETNAALLVAVGLSFLAGSQIGRRFSFFSASGLPAVVGACWLALLTTISQGTVDLLAMLPSEWLEGESSRLAVLTLAAMAVVGVPSACGAMVLEQSRSRRHEFSLTLGLIAGLMVATLLVGPIVGLNHASYVIAFGVALVWIVQQWRMGSPSVPRPEEYSLEEGWGNWAVGLACLVAAGVGGGVLTRAFAQFVPSGPYLLASGGAGVLLGVAIATMGRRFAPPVGMGRLFGALCIAGGVLLPLALFESLLKLHMHANVSISSVPMLIALRAGTVCLGFLPVGVGIGLLSASPENGRRFPWTPLAWFAFGLAATPWILPQTGVVKLALGVSAVVVLLTLPRVGLPVGQRRWQMVGVGAAGCGVLALGVLSGGYAPAQSAQLLYDANALVSWKSGIPFRLLPTLDDTRLLAVVETPQGTLTTWRNRGTAISSRLNGIPLAMAVEQPASCPLPSAEVLRAALPLMLLEQVDSILMLSDPGGMGAAVASRFPLRQITCYDPLRLGRAGQQLFPNRMDDPRFTGSTMAPHLALLMDDQHFDVVVSSPGHPAMLSHGVEFTREFYARAAARLNSGGVFCQRMRIGDFGPDALQIVARTMGEVFQQVTAIELSGGEIALLGSLGEEALVTESLDKRLQRTHVRRLLADLGWDWSMPLNLKSISDKELRKFSDPVAANTAASDLLAHYLPLEMMRWAPKGAELQEAIGSAAVPLAQIATNKDDHEEIAQRIKMVERQHDMMSRYPDQPWAYRKTVRKHLSESPKSTIQRVNGQLDRVLHPEESRRIEYFKALGNALRDIEEPNLAALEGFAEPYDPMITYFLHHEIAPLYAQLGAEGRGRELSHRLKAAYFADPRDRSIRNIAAAIQLVAAHPEVTTSKTDQFDQLNGLVELLLTRWENRGTSSIPASPEMALVDVDRSLDALSKALPVMETLAGDASMSSEQWKNRADAIERTISRPLRKYRTTLMPHYHKAKHKETSEQVAENEPALDLTGSGLLLE